MKNALIVGLLADRLEASSLSLADAVHDLRRLRYELQQGERKEARLRAECEEILEALAEAGAAPAEMEIAKAGVEGGWRVDAYGIREGIDDPDWRAKIQAKMAAERAIADPVPLNITPEEAAFVESREILPVTRRSLFRLAVLAVVGKLLGIKPLSKAAVASPLPAIRVDDGRWHLLHQTQNAAGAQRRLFVDGREVGAIEGLGSSDLVKSFWVEPWTQGEASRLMRIKAEGSGPVLLGESHSYSLRRTA